MSFLGFEATPSPMGSLIALGRKFDRSFAGREEEAIKQIRTLCDTQAQRHLRTENSQCKHREVDVSTTYKNQTEGLKLIHDVEEFIVENESGIRTAFENKNSLYAPIRFKDALVTIEKSCFSASAAKAVDALGSALIGDILRRNTEHKEYQIVAATLEKRPAKEEQKLSEIDLSIANDTFLPNYGEEKREDLEIAEPSETLFGTAKSHINSVFSTMKDLIKFNK